MEKFLLQLIRLYRGSLIDELRENKRLPMPSYSGIDSYR